MNFIKKIVCKCRCGKCFEKYYNDIANILSTMLDDAKESASTGNKANNLFSKLKSFEFVLILIIWDIILQRINSANKSEHMNSIS